MPHPCDVLHLSQEWESKNLNEPPPFRTTASRQSRVSRAKLISIMNRRMFALALFLATLFIPAQPIRAQSATHTFAVSNGQFQLDGHPYQILSGEMHYPRVPRAYWRDRFRKARAMGLNTITTYVFWNLHEPRPGVYDFTGQNDVAEYIREAQQEGLNVILRPGPYVCAEWELGGYPSWLLKDRTLTLRSTDPNIRRRHESLVYAPRAARSPLFSSRMAVPSSPSRSKTNTVPSATTMPTRKP